MHHAPRVRRVESACDLIEDVERLLDRERPVRERLAQGLALDEIHHEVEAAVVEPAEREDVDHVRVVDLVDRACFALEALRAILRRADLRLQDLDRDLLADHGLETRVDLPHRTRAEEPIDQVLADGSAGGEPVRGRSFAHGLRHQRRAMGERAALRHGASS